MTTSLTLEESDGQLVILALAALSIESPGFDAALNLIAIALFHTMIAAEPVAEAELEAERARARS